MSRITLNSKCRLCRTEGTKLYLKGARCISSKCPIEKKGAVPPGMHGIKSNKKRTDYGIQLGPNKKPKEFTEFKKLNFIIILPPPEKLKGLVGHNLLSLVERRLDNVVFRAGLSLSRSHAKQLVSHGNIAVNGKRITVNSYSVNVGDKIELSKNIIDKSGELLNISDKDFKFPAWMDVNRSEYTIEITALSQVADFNPDIDINLIIEYYSR